MSNSHGATLIILLLLGRDAEGEVAVAAAAVVSVLSANYTGKASQLRGCTYIFIYL